MSQLDLMPSVAPSYNEDLAQWFTPPKLAKRIAERFLNPRFDRHVELGVEFRVVDDCAAVLEPTAGSGELVKAARDVGCSVLALDRDPRWVDYLRQRFGDAPLAEFEVEEADYLALNIADYQPTILSNFPDATKSGIDICDYLEKAMSDAGEGGTVITLMRANCLLGSERHRRVWKHAYVRDIRYLTRRPEFSGSGSGGQQEWCVVRYGLPLTHERSYRRSTVVGWWTEAWT